MLITPNVAIISFFDNLFVNENEEIGKPSFWEKLWSGQYWIDQIYGREKVSVNVWNNDLQISGLENGKQQVIVKIIDGQIPTLIDDFEDIEIDYIYNESGFQYIKVTIPKDDIAQGFWGNLLFHRETLAGKSYISKVSLNQQMSLVKPLDYADENDIARTTYNLCEDYGILDLPYSGHGIFIAVLDTGVKRDHDGLTDLDLYNESFVVDENWEDHNGHGTHCIGILAGSNTTINGEQMRGVAPNATVYSLKVLDSKGRGCEADIIAGVMRAVDIGVDIISMSLGGSIDYFSSLHDAIHYAVGKGIIVVAAAGNSANVVSSQPASWEGVISVEALDERKHIAEYTCLGGDVSAEGTNITSLSYKNDNRTSTKSGTSMSTPFVAGCIALLLEAQPSLRGKPYKAIEQIKTTGNYAPENTESINWFIIPAASDNYAYDTREINPKYLVDLKVVSDKSKQILSDIWTNMLRESDV